MKVLHIISTMLLALLLAGCGSTTALSTASPAASPTRSVPTPTTPLTTPPATPAPRPTVTTAQIGVDGLTRDYTVVAPPDVANRGPLPLFVLMHGPNVTTSEARQIGNADELARDPGAVLVWAEAYQDGWNAGTCCKPATTDAIDDIAFIDALVNHIEADYSVDPNRVFIGGDGIGGAMAYRAACELSDRFAAVAVVSGPLLADCAPAKPIPVLHIHGTADTLFPYDGGGTACDGPCPSVAQTMERWRQADGCTGEPTTTTEGIVDTTTFSTCGAGAEVQFVKANGLDDTWLGPGIDDLAVIWAFLTNHARAAGSTG
jgi:polyhydroxybutyrate depolymerase